MLIREACVETFQEALRAREQGAERVELCDRLDLGGTTPSYALIESVRKALSIPVMVMIRPRGGNFVYDPMEIKIMQQNIETCKKIGVSGVVFGLLKRSGTVDQTLTKHLVEFASPMEVTFHKAIDVAPDPVAAIEELKWIQGITRVLSSGGAYTALTGASVLNEMIRRAEKRIIIMAGGKVTSENLEEMAQIIHTSEFHGKKIVGPLTG